ncbi:IucA/IucC family protein [Streptomyces sp. NRRL S-1813]|uniref:IucA/IucC family protein n=1 Tax=Streptomyces sp. NRRL S-1813 TaxID=1463888 RepID=UPI0004C6D453|nr:IucA/IucC family siderophore biosynthesis protein [Streptomyces sp. NRRL S-1813]
MTAPSDGNPHLSAQDAVAHLTPDLWARANRLLIRKGLAEFSHERLLAPKRLPQDGQYVVHSDDGAIAYRFAARRLALDHWQIDAESITRHRDDSELPLDAVAFFIELRGSLGLGDEILPVYLEEISSTLSGTAYKLAAQQPTAAELTKSGFQAIETGMTEGHPCFVANNGRLGFGIHEYHAYAPETASPLRLMWLAAHRDHATFTAGADLDYDTLIRDELTDETRTRFTTTLTTLGLDPADYYFFPTHPWQWWNKLSITFAAEVAEQRLVCLGPGDDDYLAQQSIRTFFNTTSPTKHYVKTALSVLNMGFMRGLSASYMEATPAINDWLARLIAADDTFQAARFSIIRERAALGYHHRQYEAATTKDSPYRKMLAALWRESPVPALEPGRRLATMASLLHVDRHGGSFAAALIEESGLEPAVWLRRYLDAYLTPVLHSFYAYDLVFMPHGENAILVIEDGAVERVIFKDIAEEIAVMDPQAVLPPAVERIRADVPEDKKLLSVFTDVFDCFFRFLSATLADLGTLDEDTFWRTVAACVADYQASAPHLADKFRQYDLFTDEFGLSCLNRLQLRNNQQMVDLQDPAGALQLIGTLRNPLAPYAPAS